MSFFDDILKTDAAFMTDPSFMPGTESVVITPAEGEAFTATVQVFRDVQVATELGMSLKMRIVVTRSVYPVVNTGIDRVLIAKKIGDDPVECLVSEIVNQDAGAFELQLE